MLTNSIFGERVRVELGNHSKSMGVPGALNTQLETVTKKIVLQKVTITTEFTIMEPLSDFSCVEFVLCRIFQMCL